MAGALCAAVLAASLASPAPARAAEKLSIAQQFGIAYLLLDVARDQKLIEKHGREAGIEIDVEWNTISGATAMNEGLLSGALDVASAGVPPALTMWDRTKGGQDVKLVAAIGSLPNYLITSDPAVRSLEDLGPNDRIAVPAVGVGFQSRTLQIATARLFGADQFRKFDEISVSMPHPDATAALIAGGTEINTHFSSAPFYYQALAANPDIHKIVSSYDILGGPATFNVLYATQRSHDEKPEVYRALYAALGEAAAWVRDNKREAAAVFIRQQNSKLAPDLVQRIVEDPENDFTLRPEKIAVYASELHKLGVLRNEAASWQDFFFPEARSENGS